MRARWCFGLAAVLSTASGCTETMRHHVDDGFRATHADIRGVDIDVEASEVHLVAHRELDADDAAEVRQEVAEGIGDVLGQREGGKPARFRVEVLDHSTNTVLAIVPCFIVLTLVGCPTELESARVKVELEVDGRRFEEIGEGDRIVFNYSDDHSTVVAPGSVGIAIANALERIDAKAKEGE